MFVVAVTGGRDYSDREHVFSVLDKLHQEHRFEVLVHGGAKGADALAAEWCNQAGVFQCIFPVTPALWSRIGKRAGPLRSHIMQVVTRPTLLVAFPGGEGTAGAVKSADTLRIDKQDERNRA